MKVGELIEKLQQYDSELDVLGFNDNEECLIEKGESFRLLNIESVDCLVGEKCRTGDRLPSMIIGKQEHSEEHVVLNVQAQF